MPVRQLALDFALNPDGVVDIAALAQMLGSNDSGDGYPQSLE
jgi:hypothetical protein